MVYFKIEFTHVYAGGGGGGGGGVGGVRRVSVKPRLPFSNP